MLDITKAIREDYIFGQGKHRDGKSYTYKRKVHIFNCVSCGKEIVVWTKDVENHQGRCKPCGFILGNPRNRIRPYECIYKKLVKSAKEVRRECSITYEEFVELTKIRECHYCLAPIEWVEFNTTNGSKYQLDRKDNSLGYTKENCVVCCTKCNMIKRNFFTYDQFLEVGKLIQKFNLENQSAG